MKFEDAKVGHTASFSSTLNPEVLEAAGTLQSFVERAAPLAVDMVLEGETGTGKDTLARRIHQLSRRKGAFVAINCAAIPEHLAESELFGVTVGAFTGALKSRAGYIEASHQGTLYLDEIDSMPLLLQAKLLRVLEVRGVERLGSTTFIQLDLRVIVATKTPLERLVEEGRFRRDLYFRLNVIKVSLPPLRATLQRVQPLFQRFVREAAKLHKQAVPAICPHLLTQLLMHRWPGNIRELKCAAERFVLGVSPLGHTKRLGCAAPVSLRCHLRMFEKLLIQDCLSRNAFDIDAVSRDLEIPKRTLYSRIKILQINIEGKR